MSDLISKSALFENVGKIETEFYCDETGTYNPVMKTMKILNCIEDAPTAYDLEEVVKQLEESTFPITLFGETVLVLKKDKAIEIVRKDGVK